MSDLGDLDQIRQKVRALDADVDRLGERIEKFLQGRGSPDRQGGGGIKSVTPEEVLEGIADHCLDAMVALEAAAEAAECLGLHRAERRLFRLSKLVKAAERAISSGGLP